MMVPKLENKFIKLIKFWSVHVFKIGFVNRFIVNNL